VEDFRKEVRTSIEATNDHINDGRWSRFESCLQFAGGGFSKEDGGELPGIIDKLRSDMGAQTALVHYLAVPPSSFTPFTSAMQAHGLVDRAKVVYEKPFGTSPSNFEELDEFVHTIFDEQNVYRIDHFLGKEATQNIHTGRFANRMLENIWNRQNVAAVQIDMPETLNIDDRAVFYDQTGALLDMIVTHLFQLAAEVAMEPPLSLHAGDLSDARETVISAFRPLNAGEVVLGQYEGYRSVDGVEPNSQTDTFVAARLWIDTDRWHGVPFLLRTGKMMARKAERVTLILHRADSSLHHQPRQPSTVSFDLAGGGGVDVSLTLKHPGAGSGLTSAGSSIDLAQLGDALSPYERLIHDVTVGDKSRFTRSDGLRYAWKAITPLLENRPAVQPYAPGSWGPAAAEALADPYGWLQH
jgi:glucose-6-phosphate 1-dehydrogenase